MPNEARTTAVEEETMSGNGEWTVVVVGGAGAMGRYAVRSIARLGSASRLIVADKNVEYGERLVAEVGGPCEFLELDVTDEAALRSAFAEADVVCGTLGPFTIFGGPIMGAALECGCNYLDIDDDWQSTVEAFERQDLAVEKDVTTIVGIGSSPGFSNMLAMLAAECLDEVETLYTGWNLRDAVAEEEPDYPTPPSGSAAVEHWLLQCAGKIRAWEDGAYADVTPVEKEVLQLPGFGEQIVYSMGHPEPITLPRSVPGLRRARNFQVGPDWLLDYVRSVASDYDAGRVSLEEGARLLQNPPRPEQRSDAPRPARLPYNWAMATGTKDGRRRSVMTYPNGEPKGRMGGHTGVPLSIGVELLRQGTITKKGVLAPEEAIDPHVFIDWYAKFLDVPDGAAAVAREEADAA
jgi:saccharopine dehydrogenase (NAD+, L-lysine forming)